MLSKQESQEQTQKSPLQRFLFVLGMVFFLLYLALGITMIFWKQLPVVKDIPIILDSNGRLAFGILLIAYSFFRFIRLWQNR